jgi:hypothetical protein
MLVPSYLLAIYIQGMNVVGRSRFYLKKKRKNMRLIFIYNKKLEYKFNQNYSFTVCSTKHNTTIYFTKVIYILLQ